MTLLSPEKLASLNVPVPRYTSYPTALEWEPLSYVTYEEHLAKLQDRPLSLYLHIPFCTTMCLYCACSVVLNRQPERQTRYVHALLHEIDLVSAQLQAKPLVRQLHFGGGTPTQLTREELQVIMERLQERFTLDPSGEIAMEIDPRTILEDEGAKLRHLKALGFNRVSFGVQDTSPKVQEAVRRRQSLAMTRQTFQWARELEFSGINIDLIYGLPYQTPATFAKTVDDILELGPDRIALFSYAKVPWLKPHQKAIKEKTLPSTESKFTIYANARDQFLKAGYVAIGMDHFAKPDDSLAQAFFSKTLQRNFQGYSLKLAEDMIGLGLTSTGLVSDAYFQNQKDLPSYYAALEKDELPTLRGKVLTPDDQMRKWVIHRLMCDFELCKEAFAKQFGKPFDRAFSTEARALQKLASEGLLEITTSHLKPTLYGSLFIRNIASVFDAYLQKKGERRFSMAV